MLGSVKEINGRVVEFSQFERKSDGVFYQFLKLSADDGNVYHIRNVIVPAQIDPDVQSGEECSFYIFGFRNAGTGFFKRNFILASSGSRGISLPRSRMFFMGIVTILLGTALISPFLYWMGHFTSALIVAPFLGMRAVWVAAIWPIVLVLHIAWSYVTILVHINILKVRLLGMSRSQTLPGGQVIKTL